MGQVQRDRKLVGAAGVLGFAVPAIGSLILAPTWDFPASTASGTSVASYVLEHQSALQFGALLDAIGVTLWGLFGVGVWQLLRQNGQDRFLLGCFLAGVLWMVSLLLAGFTAFLVLAYRPAEYSPSEAHLLYDLTFGLLAMSGLPTAVALGAYAAIASRRRILPAWTALLGAIGALAHLVLLASFVSSGGFFSLEGQTITVIPATLFVWVLGTAVAVLRLHDVD